MPTDDALGPQSPTDRQHSARELRRSLADGQFQQAHPLHRHNGDDGRYADARGSFTKGLAHDPATGLGNQAAYQALRQALASGSPEQFERIPLNGGRRLVNPQAGLAFDTEGADGHALTLPPAPAFASDEIAAEIVENYWMALLRDVRFEQYAADPLAAQAAAELTTFGSDFRGPKEVQGGALAVTPATLFRGLTPGDLRGPYLSQFMLLPVPFGSQGFDQRQRTPKAGVDFGTTWRDFLRIQNGVPLSFANPADFEATTFLLRNGRDLGQYVHIDVLFQAYFNAALILLQGPNHPTPVDGGLGAPLNPGNPYHLSRTQDGFGTFGGPYIAATLCEVATRALKAVWFQKWFLHRRLRPEAFAGRIHAQLTGAAAFDLSAKATGAAVLAEISARNPDNTFLLPLAFPEGSPVHPAYGAGHATVAGACVTLLKAFFDGDRRLVELAGGTFRPQQVDAAGTGLVDYTGADAGELTVGGELDKLASNVAIGRNIAGVHWRSDGTESLFLGEAVAMSLLRDHRRTTNERFAGYEFTTFAGHRVRI
jgi:membrane-associated phospholipid phosphatase